MKIGHEFLYLSEADVIATDTSIVQHIDAVEQALRYYEAGQAQVPEVAGLEFADHEAIHTMPAAIEPIGAVGQKWMTVFWKNPKERGLPFLHGFVILNDIDTGAPVCAMDAKLVTGYRTGAMNGVACRHLANQDAKVLGVLGCGLEGRSHLEAIKHERPGIESVLAWGPTPDKVNAYCIEMQQLHGIPVKAAASIEEVVRAADILAITAPGVNTAGDRNRVIVREWLKPGCTILPVNQDAHFVHGTLPQLDRIYIDNESKWNSLKPLGCYQGIEATPPTIGSMLAGKTPGRQSHDEVIAVFHRGIGLLDVASGWLVYNEALKKGTGRILPL